MEKNGIMMTSASEFQEQPPYPPSSPTIPTSNTSSSSSRTSGSRSSSSTDSAAGAASMTMASEPSTRMKKPKKKSANIHTTTPTTADDDTTTTYTYTTTPSSSAFHTASTTTTSINNKTRLTTRRWSPEEDEQLSNLVANAPNFAKISWSSFATQMKTHRSAKQCRERYINSLKPDTKKGMWTEEEDANILQLQKLLGNQWSKIAASLPGRSDNDVKNRWHSKMRSRSVKRKERESGSGRGGGNSSVVVVVNSQQQQQQGGGGSGEEAHGNYAAAYHNGSNRNMMNNIATSTNTTSQEWKKRSKLSSSMIGRGGGGGGESSIRSNGMTWNHNTQQQQQQQQHQFAMNIDPSYTSSSPTDSFSQEGPGAKSAYGDEGVYENMHQNPICNGIHSTTTLSETEVLLCHQLLNLQRTLQMKQPDTQYQQQQQRQPQQYQQQQQYQPSSSLSGFQRAPYQSYYAEEVDDEGVDDNECDDYLMEHVQSMQSRERQRAEQMKGITKKSSSSRRANEKSRGVPNQKRAAAAATTTTTDISNDTPPKNRTKSSSSVRKKSTASSSSISSTKIKRKPLNPSKEHIVPSVNSPRNGTTSDPRALSDIRHPGKHDCLIGRGGGTNHHPGNIKFRLVIEEKKEEYRTSQRDQKPILAMQVVTYWRGMDPPGRFLKLNAASGLWDDIGNEAARIKCSQTLRERKASKLRLSDVGFEEEDEDAEDDEEDAE